MYYTPKEVVDHLDSIVVSQAEAKRALAIALRNRYRLTQIKDEMLKSRVKRKNVIFMGPTGVGKTEIVTSSCKLDGAPFVKVDATRFTEIGYVGPDVETMIHDLVEKSIAAQKELRKKEELSEAKKDEIYKSIALAILNKLNISPTEEEIAEKIADFKAGKNDSIIIEIQIPEKEAPTETNRADQMGFDIMPSSGIATVVGVPFGDFLKAFSGHKEKVRRLSAKAAFEILMENAKSGEGQEDLIAAAIKDAQERGVVFIDEIDKLINNKGSQSRGDVSREGVQRDLLPLVEGTVVQTKYGPFNTSNVLFVAAGAFHSAKPTDLLNELQGRFPIKVSLSSLSMEDFIKILSLPKYSILKQVEALLEVDRIKINFTTDGIREIAKCATELNSMLENIGARRLYGVVETVVEEISFDVKKDQDQTFEINANYVQSKMEKILSKTENKKENHII